MIFAAAAETKWILDTISGLSTNMEVLKIMMVIVLIISSIDLILSVSLMVTMWLSDTRRAGNYEDMRKSIKRLEELVEVARGWENLERTHRDTTNQALGEMKAEAKTISAKAAEIHSVIKGNDSSQSGLS